VVVGAMRRRSTAQCVEGSRIDIFPRVTRTELQQHAAYAEAHDSPDFEQLQADRIDLRLGPLGAFEGQPPQRFHQGVSHSGEVEPQLIALHLVGGEPVGEQAHLFLDAVLHFAASAVEPFV